MTKLSSSFFLLALAGFVPHLGAAEAAPAAPAAADGSTVVRVQGQAAIINADLVRARDKAIADATRLAVEQTVGALVTSETVAQNFQVISDRIYSRSSGYVKKYTIVSEQKESGVYQVTIDATVSSGNLKTDLDGILAVLKAKNMPRVLVMISEQNVGQSDAKFWWGNGVFATDLGVVENGFIDDWSPKGFTFIDRQALSGKLKVGPALTSAEPAEDAVKEFGLMAGAEVVVIGKAVATDAGLIMNTQMHSVRANISIRALNLDTGEILGTSTAAHTAGHVDAVTAGTQALQGVAR
jgi:hypothetical protein